MSFSDERRSLLPRFVSGGPLTEVVFVTSVLVAVFAFVGVPFANAALIGIAIALQASLGTVALTCVLTGVKSSVLLLFGPGLIVGGALSFALFQMTGRGWFGLAVVAATGLLASFKLMRSGSWQPETSRHWLMSQTLGLAALALTWEFGELLPLAIVCFVFGIFASQSPQFPALMRWILGIAGLGVASATYVLRQEYWWLVTDDYLLFEVISRHITKSGILADWGTLNFSRYHWLAYGWSGLLSFFGGNPEALVTLTRVMPTLYSFSLGISLMLISHTFAGPAKGHFLSILPVWTILAIHRLDWSGTSTGGVYAAISALAATIMLEQATTKSLGRRLALYVAFLPIIALTKLPGLFATFVIFSLLEVWNYASRLQRNKRRILVISAPFVTALLTLGAIHFANVILSSGSFTNVNPSLGQLAEFGPIFAGLSLLLQKFWIWAIALGGLLWAMWKPQSHARHLAHGLTYGAISILPLALLLDVKMYTVANNNEYFSGPMYFLSSFMLLLLVPFPTSIWTQSRQYIGLTVCSITLFAGGYLWGRLELAVRLWKNVAPQSLELTGQLTLLQWVSADGRIAISLAMLLAALASVWRANWRYTIVLAAMLSLTTFVLYSYIDHSRSELTRERSVEERALKTGSTELRLVGNWLKSNTQPKALIATNHIVNASGQQLSDYSLAVWSDRTFLVLGPKYGYEMSPAEASAVEISLQFAEGPTKAICRLLSEQGVEWFVVDRRLTKAQYWQVCATTAYRSENFEVLQLVP